MGLVSNPDHALGLTARKRDLKANVRNIFLQAEVTLYYGGLIDFPIIWNMFALLDQNWFLLYFYVCMFVCFCIVGPLLMANLILQFWLGWNGVIFFLNSAFEVSYFSNFHIYLNKPLKNHVWMHFVHPFRSEFTTSTSSFLGKGSLICHIFLFQ